MNRLVFLLALAGLIVSALSLRVHYSNEVQICDINAHWDCGIVNHSRYSEIAGIPVAVLGIAGYAAIALLVFARREVLLLIAAGIGCAFALYLSHIEADVLGVWCLYCVISQTIIALIFGLALATWIRSVLKRRREIRMSEFTKQDLLILRSQRLPQDEDTPESPFHSVRLHPDAARSGYAKRTLHERCD